MIDCSANFPMVMYIMYSNSKRANISGTAPLFRENRAKATPTQLLRTGDLGRWREIFKTIVEGMSKIKANYFRIDFTCFMFER